MVNPEPAAAAATLKATGRRVQRSSGGKKSNAESMLSPRLLSGEDRYRMIAEAAYFRAEQRGFSPGNELDDWLAAEIEIDVLLEQELDRDVGRA